MSHLRKQHFDVIECNYIFHSKMIPEFNITMNIILTLITDNNKIQTSRSFPIKFLTKETNILNLHFNVIPNINLIIRAIKY